MSTNYSPHLLILGAIVLVFWALVAFRYWIVGHQDEQTDALFHTIACLVAALTCAFTAGRLWA